MWYHLSYKYIGTTIVLEPQVPIYAPMNEGNILRICVSNHPYFCVRSLCSSINLIAKEVVCQFATREFVQNSPITISNPAVYVTNNQPYIPPNITSSDCWDNNERWFLQPVTFDFIGFLDLLSFINKQIQYTNQQTFSYIFTENQLQQQLLIKDFISKKQYNLNRKEMFERKRKTCE